MIKEIDTNYTPTESECEKASISYLISMFAMVVGLPIPIFNLLATLIFYFANAKGTYFVRWHCLQALLSQIILVGINSVAFWWTVGVIWFHKDVTTSYFGYLGFVLTLNIIEFISTIYMAIATRKGKHVEWWPFAILVNILCNQDLSDEEKKKRAQSFIS